MQRDNIMNKTVRNLLVAALTLLPATVLADPTAQALAFTCAGCHGTDGSSVGPSSPSIAGMDPEVFVDAMQAYKADQRNATIMDRIAKGYTDEQIKGMSWFFAKQPLLLKPQKHDPDLAKLGADLHKEYCEKCHSDGGRESDSGILAGQWMPYLEYSMTDFVEGRRAYPRKMKRKVDAVLKEHGKKAQSALIHFYGSQQ